MEPVNTVRENSQLLVSSWVGQVGSGWVSILLVIGGSGRVGLQKIDPWTSLQSTLWSRTTGEKTLPPAALCTCFIFSQHQR